MSRVALPLCTMLATLSNVRVPKTHNGPAVGGRNETVTKLLVEQIKRRFFKYLEWTRWSKWEKPSADSKGRAAQHELGDAATGSGSIFSAVELALFALDRNDRVIRPLEMSV
jgi:hypothetical protein